MERNLTDLFVDQKKQKLIFYLFLIFNLALAFILMVSPVTSIKGAEPNVIYTIQMTMLNNSWMYQDPETIPFSATQYTPLYYMLCSSLGNLLSLTPGDEVVAIYKISRMISVVAAMLSGYFIFLLLSRVHGINFRWSCWIALSGILCTIPWYYAARPDSVMALFFFASLYYFSYYQKDSKQPFKYLLLSGALTAFSFFTKQNGLILSLAIGSYLLLIFRIKDLGIFIAGVAAGTLLFFLIFWPFYSEFFFQHLRQGLNNGIDVKSAIDIVYYTFASRFGTLFILTILIISIVIYQLSYRAINHELRFLIYLLIILLPFSIITALKVGSDINYFHEVIIISLITLAKGGSIIMNVFAEGDNKWVEIFVFCLVFGFALSLSLSGFFGFGIRNIKRMNEKDDVYKKELLSFIKNVQKKNDSEFYILSENEIVLNSFPLQTVLPHHDIASLWYSRKVYDFAKLKKAVTEGTILLYVGNGDKLSPYNINLDGNFVHIETIDGNKIYRNKNVTSR